jgi:hypothetical protein
MAGDIELQRPDGLDETAWNSIEGCRVRLERARRDLDWSLVVGSAKDLVEATAKVVIAARGGTSPSEQEYVEALNEAHKALGRQPGPDLSDDPQILAVASSMLKIARSLREPRNQYGPVTVEPWLRTFPKKLFTW